MFKDLRKTIVSLLSAATLLVVPLAVPAIVAAEPSGSGADIQNCLALGGNLEVPSVDTDCGTPDTSTGSTNLNNVIKIIINAFSILVGVVAVIMIIYGGFRYITSGGDSSKITSAKNTIIYAIIGLIVVALAQVIVKFVLGKVINNS